MPEPSWQQSLTWAVDCVLETMFFAAPDGPADPADLEPADLIRVRLSFEGAISGSLLVRASAGAARALASDFLGVGSDELTPGQVTDVVCELANMICGNVVSALDSEDLMRLSSAIPDDQPSPPNAAVADYAIAIPNGALHVTIEKDVPNA